MNPSTWYLSLFGSIELRGPDADAANRVVVKAKQLALLVYLTISDAGERHQRFHRRDHLVGLLWPELDQAHARASLRQAVHYVRAALGADILVARGDEELALGESALTSDVVAFTDHISNGRLAEALGLHRGELLPGFHLSGCAEFQRWLDDRRRDLQVDAAGAAWVLAEQQEAESHKTLALRWARRSLEFSWEDERVLRRALDMLDRLGDRAGALRVFDEFSQRLRAAYDADPSPETQRIIAGIRSR